MAAKSQKIGRKFERTTKGQIKFYIEFCKKHPEISQKRWYGKIAPLHVQELWSQLAEKLNSMKGPTRTLKKWKEAFTIWKSMVRYRARKNAAQTGSRYRREDLLKLTQCKKTENHEVPTKKLRQPELKPSNAPHPTAISKAQSDVEFPFDSIFLPSDEERREREEILSVNHQNVITKLDQTLTEMNRVLEKINGKL
ncbi:PREDICTED: uncharacterized protein LOC108365911 [Rhagoletis zephyria]|uniref:uncharacterized protein LOC108365911 n=1 Tax=Rhagoletis zephyria TaxID=28612 RepID=UPI0008115C34|nr:PREDICTED: uncharacterized protein LOC108365911 [Rhagoletis zephyria]